MLNTDHFPYLIIDDSNAHLFCSGGPQARATGYQGWQRPGLRRTAFAASRPVGQTIPRSQWHDRIKAGAPVPRVKARFCPTCSSRGHPGQGPGRPGLLLGLRLDAGGRGPAGGARAGHARPLARERGRPLHPLAQRGRLRLGGLRPVAELRGLRSRVSWTRRIRCIRNRWKSGWQENAALHEAVDWYDIESDRRRRRLTTK